MTRFPSLSMLSDGELDALILRCERAIFAGTSTLRDVDLLVGSERELARRIEERAGLRCVAEMSHKVSHEAFSSWRDLLVA